MVVIGLRFGVLRPPLFRTFTSKNRFQPAQRAIGAKWESNTITVSEIKWFLFRPFNESAKIPGAEFGNVVEGMTSSNEEVEKYPDTGNGDGKGGRNALAHKKHHWRPLFPIKPAKRNPKRHPGGDWPDKNERAERNLTDFQPAHFDGKTGQQWPTSHQQGK